MDIKTFRRATPSSVGRSGKIGSDPVFPDLPTDDGVARRNVLMSIPTIPPDLSIDLTTSIVSCQSCVVYTTFVGNSVLSFTTSKLNIKISLALAGMAGANLSRPQKPTRS